MAEPRQFQVVENLPEQPRETAAEKAGTKLLLMGLSALSQRAIAAIADLFMLTTVGSAFWLWMAIPKPDLYQLVALAMYGLFVLAANYIVRRR